MRPLVLLLLPRLVAVVGPGKAMVGLVGARKVGGGTMVGAGVADDPKPGDSAPNLLNLSVHHVVRDV